MTYSAGSAMRAYNSVNTQSRVAEATPHRLISLLLDGALEKIALAKGHILRNEITPKVTAISRAISIIDGLRLSLDHTIKNELIGNLDELYSYMARRLLQANLKSDGEALDEVSYLLKEIREAWNAIDASAANPAAVEPVLE
ncbi:MAG TPA: flagellar export chaperone FliS [Spongiibacteraceae bacterium]|nr:flagellar export chaperone FliS [Spongiibacteraceae bacterium]HCS26632.1 flagellar export chaperone FliS [Spongiibacteraceae bacterium]